MPHIQKPSLHTWYTTPNFEISDGVKKSEFYYFFTVQLLRKKRKGKGEEAPSEGVIHSFILALSNRSKDEVPYLLLYLVRYLFILEATAFDTSKKIEYSTRREFDFGVRAIRKKASPTNVTHFY